MSQRAFTFDATDPAALTITVTTADVYFYLDAFNVGKTILVEGTGVDAVNGTYTITEAATVTNKTKITVTEGTGTMAAGSNDYTTTDIYMITPTSLKVRDNTVISQKLTDAEADSKGYGVRQTSSKAQWELLVTEGNGWNNLDYAYKLDAKVEYTGTDSGSSSAAFLTDSTATWKTNELVGYSIVNTPDGSRSVVTANTSTQVTGVLIGGTTNLWNSGNAYVIRKPAILDHRTRGEIYTDLTGGVNFDPYYVTNEYNTDYALTSIATAASISVKGGNVFKLTGTTTIGDITGGIVGQTIVLLAEASVTITSSDIIKLNSGSNYVMAATDTLTLTMFDTNVWSEVGRSVN